MKTVKDWQESGCGWIHKDLIKQVQLDAMKEGARRSALKANNYNNDLDSLLKRCGQNDMSQWYVAGRNDSSKAILSDAEQWTIKDL